MSLATLGRIGSHGLMASRFDPRSPRGGSARLALAASLGLSLALGLGGCDCGAPTGGCASSAECPAGQACIDRVCVAREDAGPLDGGARDASGADAPFPSDAGCVAPRLACGEACCAAGERCYAGTTCIPDRGECASGDDCWSDSRCEGGICVPWGTPAEPNHDDRCTRAIDIESIEPDVQCRWVGPPDGDPFPLSVHVMATPVVVDFDLDDDPATLRPSIVFTTFPTVGHYTNPGVLRVIDGASCEQTWTSSVVADATMAPAPVAVGDLDGDGRPEIVAAAHGGGVIAFAWDPDAHTFVRRWRSGTCAGGARTPDATGGTDKWSGPSIHDLDDDGVAEVLYGATVYDAEGCVLDASLGFPAYSKGYVPVIADVDEDGKPELVLGNGLYEWSSAGWVAEPYFHADGLTPGQVAVADLGDFPLASGEDRVEIVVVSAGRVRVQTIEGTVVFGPYAILGEGTGGAPTIADFDGDGRREFATAGGGDYVVYDLDCVGTPDPSRCASSRTDGVLWNQPSQDRSSSVTGSSVFDFDADGAAEVVYADECYLRIYRGIDGVVLYSAPRSSGTTYENPVIVDVDGDFHSEIVSSVNDYGSIACPATDPLHPSTGYEHGHGIVVLRDVEDRWAASRPVWNQHAYSVTNVGDRGQIPRSSAASLNWRDPELNNFRQNVQGELAALGIPDLTTAAVSDRLRVPCDETGHATLRARVCNRGALPMAAGFVVEFRAGAADGPVMCRVESPTFLGVGACEEASCTSLLPSDHAVDVYVVADPDGSADECYEGNNFGLQPNVGCDTVD